MKIFKRPPLVGVDSDAALAEARKLIGRRIEQPARRAFLQRSLTLGGLSMLTGCSISDNAGVEAALVAAGSVLVKDTLLDALVEDRDGGAVGIVEGLLIAGGEGLAHDAQGAAELGLVGAVDGRASDGLTGALQGRHMICHSARLFSFCLGLCRKNGMLEEAVARGSAAALLQSQF